MGCAYNVYASLLLDVQCAPDLLYRGHCPSTDERHNIIIVIVVLVHYRIIYNRAISRVYSTRARVPKYKPSSLNEIHGDVTLSALLAICERNPSVNIKIN